MTRLGMKEGVARSSLILEINWDKCDNCGACAKRCQVKALTTEGKGKKRKLLFDSSLCMGCGLCIRACKKREAIKMVPRPEAPIPKKTYLELGYALLKERRQDMPL